MKRLQIYLCSLGLVFLASSLSAQQDTTREEYSRGHRCGVTEKHFIGGRGLRSLRAANFDRVKIANDNNLRVYRLILPVDYSAYTQMFNSNVDEVKAFWREAEEFLNKVYMRDVGIKFELIQSDKVIIKEKSKEKFPQKSPEDIISNGTKVLDGLAPPTYDIGVWLTKTTIAEVGGLAYGGVIHGMGTREYTAGAMVTQRNVSTLAHEIGHMFGANHTFYQGGEVTDDTNGTESFWGESIMGYSPRVRDYFALSNVYEMREHIKQKGYNNKKKGHSYPRIVKYTNSAPKLDKSKYKASYKVPLGSFFNVAMTATDANNHKLFYGLHFAKQPRYDFANEQEQQSKMLDANAHPHFYSAPFREVRPQPFQLIPNPENTDYALNAFGKPYNSVFFKGDYTLWLAVRDASHDANFKVLYDSHQIGISIVEGTAFDILPESNFKTKYKGGERIDLRWSVDRNIFPADSKVRILLSDDYGQTFAHTLVESTANDGAEAIVLPNRLYIDKSNNAQWPRQVGMGVIRIEVIDHVVFADSHIGGEKRRGQNQRYSFTLEATEDGSPAERPPVPTEQPIDRNNTGNQVSPKAPTDNNGSNVARGGTTEHSIRVQISSGSGTLEYLRLANDVVRVLPRPANGQRVKGIKVRIAGKPELDITATHSFTLMGDATILVEFEQNTTSPTLKVFPSPAVDYVTISSTHPNATIYITTLTGERRLLGRTNQEGMARCHIGGYPTGSYLITVGTTSQRIQIR